jgi:hypothetical protein
MKRFVDPFDRECGNEIADERLHRVESHTRNDGV